MTRHTMFLRFEMWDGHQLRPIPDGTRVFLCDDDPLMDDVLSEGMTLNGRIALTGSDPDEAQPDLYLRLRLPDGTAWCSKGRAATDGTPGLLHDQRPGWLGAPDTPLVFRLDWLAFLALVAWDAESGGPRALAPGVPVALIEHDPFGQQRVIATSETDADGRVVLAARDLTEEAPDLSVRVGPGGGLTSAWDSREAFAVDAPDQPGMLVDHRGPGLGHSDAPVVFDVRPGTPRWHVGCGATLLIDGVALLEALEQAIGGATQTLHVEIMLFFADDSGWRVARTLAAAAARGVMVRLLVDWNTTRTIHQLIGAERMWTRALRTLEPAARDAELARLAALAPEEEARGEVDALVAFLETQDGITLLDSSFSRLSLDPSLPEDIPAAYREAESALPFFTLARIDHRKLIIVDGERALLGGQNIGQEYLYTEPFDPDLAAEDEPWHKWHDVFVALDGSVVGDCERLFRERWVAEGGDEFPLDPVTAMDAHSGVQPDTVPEGLRVRLLRTTPGHDHELERVLLQRLATARREIWVASPYFSSPEARDALCAAARRGVRVVFILPDGHNDSIDFLYAGRLAYEGLLDAGVEVYEYQRRMSHTKVLAIDDAAIIGSANLNRTSFRRHYEVAALIDDAAFTETLRERLFAVDLARARRITAADLPALLDINVAARAWLRGVVWTLF
jgi:phosphatidylserine/phosphatidylglycerophosphate/cardiolipin synthase-like enzyme